MSKHSEPFKEMAADIERNPEESFGGAFLIVLGPTENLPDGKIIKGTLFGMKDTEAVLSLVEAQIRLTLNDMQQTDQWGGRR